MLYLGIYHTMVTKDLFTEEDNQKLYLKANSFLHGLHASYYMIVSHHHSGFWMISFQVLLIIVCISISVGFITLLIYLTSL